MDITGMDDEARHELKFVCEEAAHARVLAFLRLRVIGFRRLHPTRRVQSIYLDSHNNGKLGESLAGISHREKIRFRWYGPGVNGVRGVLENKIRSNGYGRKQKYPLMETVDLQNIPCRRLIRFLADHAPPDWRARLAFCPEPVQWITYDRAYFTNWDESLRITLDRNLQTYDQRGRSRLSTHFPTARRRLLIAEIKCPVGHYEAAQALINRLPIMVAKCSKFVLASAPGDGPQSSYWPD